jgi:hypothetical protein
MSGLPSFANAEIEEILQEFETKSGLEKVGYEVKPRPDGYALVIKLAQPSERFFKILEETRGSRALSSVPVATIIKSTPQERLQSPEARYLLRVLSESLNISRLSFKDDFFARYTKSVSNAEAQITAAANHIVFGRRGAGKSSLLLYAMRTRDRNRQPSAWVDMQVFGKRNDIKVFIDLLMEVLSQLRATLATQPQYSSIVGALERLRLMKTVDENDVRLLLPEVRSLLASFQSAGRDLFIFLDDLHVLATELQPKLLGFIYSITRGNGIFLKLSSIETLTNTWDTASQTGLQVPHDAQTINLDYNLTMPDRAAKHIESILDAHAKYCGLPSVRFLCTSSDVLSRLVWVSAGVPRDALNVFAQAMTKGAATGGSRVSVTNINLAASEMVGQKLRELDLDVPEADVETSLSGVLEKIKDFCIKQQRKNAFLVELRGDTELYHQIQKLVDLRLLHVISEGITVGEAGRKYLALILDYGFYTGIRAAQSVDLFNRQTLRVTYKELRKLPVLHPD